MSQLQFRLPTRVLLCYITDRRQFPGSEREKREALLRKVSEAARCGVDFIQLREKDLSARELLELAQQAVAAIGAAVARTVASGNSQPTTRLLINSRVDIAIACGAGGVHLRSDDISAADARAAWSAAAAHDAALASRGFTIACSCHTAEEVRRAEADGADFVVFAPVFEKGGHHGVGLDALRAACCGTAAARTPEASPPVKIPVLALGGITLANAQECVAAGAAGIAAIRLFQDNDVAEIVRKLRG